MVIKGEINEKKLQFLSLFYQSITLFVECVRLE